MAVVIGIRGPSGSGKTTLIERLIPRLRAQGLTVGVIKHAHDGLTLDPDGKDSWRMWRSGAQAVLVAGPREWFLREHGADPTLAAALSRMPEALDCILVEGFLRQAGSAAARVDIVLDIAEGGVRLNGRLLDAGHLAEVETAILAARGQVRAASS